MEACLHPTETMKTVPSWLLGEAEASVGAERVGVRVVHSYSEVNWIYGPDVVLPHKSVGLTEATGLRVPLRPGSVKVLSEEDMGEGGEEGYKYTQRAITNPTNKDTDGDVIGYVLSQG